MIPDKVQQLLKLFPEPWEVPRVEQAQLHRLYLGYVRGEKDVPLLEEVESRLLARIEIWKQIQEYWEENDTQEEEQVIDNFVLLSERYGLVASGQPSDFLDGPYEALLKARKSGNYDKRMLAIDRTVTFAHDAGPLADMFVVGGEKFLDWLSSKQADIQPWPVYERRRPSINRRPIHVRSHARRSRHA